MSATNNEVIQDALGLLGVLNEIETLTAEQGAHGLRVLNDLMAEWEAAGIDIGHFPQVNPTEDFPGSYKVLMAVKYALAAALAPFYGKRLAPEDGIRGERLYGRLVRDAAIAKMTEAETDHLPMGTNGGMFDIITGQ